MFQVFSKKGNVSGCLLLKEGDNLLYANTHETNSNEEVVALPAGSSYEIIIADGDCYSINFESHYGAADGVTDKLLLQMLIHRTGEVLKQNYTEHHSMALRAYQMAFDALNV